MLREVQVSLFVSGGVSPELSVGRFLELLLFMVKSLPICTDMLWTLTYLQVVRGIITRASGRVYRASLSLHVSADIFRKNYFAYNLRNCYRHVKTKSEGFLTLLCRYLFSKTSFRDNFGQTMSLLTTVISYQGQTDKKDCAIFLLRGNRDEQRAFYVLIQRWNTDMKKLETSWVSKVNVSSRLALRQRIFG